ncbi:MAG: carbonic anhydrase [Pyrinomonadaceae bacterium]|nr:carbonic anhydrase [Pyrinomonadaceae bacterium]
MTGSQRAGSVQTKKSRDALSTGEALQKLLEGNKRFLEKSQTSVAAYRNQISETVEGQFPFAAILSCVDSRVSVEHIFDLNNGDAFNARVAGNIANPDILGSFEFATKLAGSKVIMVMGHTGCGAVEGACDNVTIGNLTVLLSKIKPAVAAIGEGWTEGEKSSENDKFVNAVAIENVKRVKADILERSEVIRNLVDENEVKLVGAMYDISTGKVSLIES